MWATTPHFRYTHRPKGWRFVLVQSVRTVYDLQLMDDVIVPAGELRKHLAEHLDDVLAGATFTITRSGRPTATLAPWKITPENANAAQPED